ncbi:hypothetical protein MNBD_GAMMA07-160 [hydrothermal vent metagenome]|uniref:NAD synthetase n=1 Tax=hydrothermal vent metagenome TaxID=652676 RepID=A0A3B0XEN6_9ZZZZ
MPQLIINIFPSDFSHLPKKTTPFDDPTCRRRLIDRITKLPGFGNCRIVYIGNGPAVVIRDFPATFTGKDITVAIRPVTGRKQVNDEIHPMFSDSQKDERFYNELVDLGFNCGAAFITGMVALFGVATAPISGSTSLLLTATAGPASAATGLQCFNSVYRLINESNVGNNPQMNLWLDSQDWYSQASLALDGLSLLGAAGVGRGLLQTVQISRKAGTSIPQILKGLNNKKRLNLTIEILKTQNPTLRMPQIHALILARKLPKNYSALALNYTLRTQLINAVGASLSLAGSARSGLLNKAGNVSIEGASYIINVIEEMDTH